MSATNMDYLQAFLGILKTLNKDSEIKLGQELIDIEQNLERTTTPSQRRTADSLRSANTAYELPHQALEEYKTLNAIALKAKFMRSAGVNFKFSDLDAESLDAFNRIRQVLIKKLNHPLIPDDPNLWIVLHHMCVLKPINDSTITSWSPTLKEDGSPQSNLLYLSCGRAYSMEELTEFQQTQDLLEPVDFGIGATQRFHRYDIRAVSMNLHTRKKTSNTYLKTGFHCLLKGLKYTFIALYSLELASSALQTAAAFIGPEPGSIALKALLAVALFSAAQMGFHLGHDKARCVEIWMQHQNLGAQHLDIHLAL